MGRGEGCLLEGVDHAVAEGVVSPPAPAHELAAADPPARRKNPPGRDGGPRHPWNPLRVGRPIEEAPAAGQAFRVANAPGRRAAALDGLRASGGSETSGHRASRIDGAGAGGNKNQHRYEEGGQRS